MTRTGNAVVSPRPHSAGPEPDARPKRLIILAAQSSAEADGIRDYTNRLVAELSVHEAWETQVRLRPSGQRPRPLRLAADVDVILVQYNPFWYGRWGFAPSLPLDLWRLRRARPKPVIALMVHETFVDMKNWRWALMGAWQRLQLLAIQPLADVRFGSIEAWTELLRRMWPRTPVHHLPVASNFPDMRGQRARARSALGVSDQTLVLACFGLNHPGRLPGHVTRAVEALAEAGEAVLLLNLGTESEPSRPWNGQIRMHAPGYLDHESVARLLSAADIFLAPYGDGVSTRRTTVMTAFQHELPVVGTAGHLTDSAFLSAGNAMVLTPVHSPDAFARAVCMLAQDPARRRSVARAGRVLYESRFDWPHVAGRMLAAFDRAVEPA
jgi:glycosyltransferase involved in cell wall biosynthesis